MAEFQVVMKQAKRMCESYGDDCARCALYRRGEECLFDCPPNAWNVNAQSDVERIVMDWAEKHPEPRYPSWNEAWKQLFPDAEESFAPCLKRMLPAEQTHKYCAVYTNPLCKECRSQPIPADIAERLGIKPIGGVNDEHA